MNPPEENFLPDDASDSLSKISESAVFTLSKKDLDYLGQSIPAHNLGQIVHYCKSTHPKSKPLSKTQGTRTGRMSLTKTQTATVAMKQTSPLKFTLKELTKQPANDLDRKILYMKRHYQETNNIRNLQILLNYIRDISNEKPKWIASNLPLVSTILCSILSGNHTSLIIRAIELLRELSEKIGDAFATTYSLYFEVLVDNLRSTKKFVVEQSQQIVYEFHSSFEPEYFIFTLYTGLLKAKNPQARMNYLLSLYQLLSEVKTDLNQYCPVYFHSILLMVDQFQPMKQLNQEIGSLLQTLYSEEELIQLFSSHLTASEFEKICLLLRLELAAPRKSIFQKTKRMSRTSMRKSMTTTRKDSSPLLRSAQFSPNMSAIPKETPKGKTAEQEFDDQLEESDEVQRTPGAEIFDDAEPKSSRHGTPSRSSTHKSPSNHSKKSSSRHESSSKLSDEENDVRKSKSSSRHESRSKLSDEENDVRRSNSSSRHESRSKLSDEENDVRKSKSSSRHESRSKLSDEENDVRRSKSSSRNESLSSHSGDEKDVRKSKTSSKHSKHSDVSSEEENDVGKSKASKRNRSRSRSESSDRKESPVRPQVFSTAIQEDSVKETVETIQVKQNETHLREKYTLLLKELTSTNTAPRPYWIDLFESSSESDGYLEDDEDRDEGREANNASRVKVIPRKPLNLDDSDDERADENGFCAALFNSDNEEFGTLDDLNIIKEDSDTDSVDLTKTLQDDEFPVQYTDEEFSKKKKVITETKETPKPESAPEDNFQPITEYGEGENNDYKNESYDNTVESEEEEI